MSLSRFALKPAAATLLAFVALLASFVPLLAAPPSDAVLADCRLTVRAREAMRKDELLRDLNLGVTVRNHVATLWGPVPSKLLSRRSAECVRRVPGIADVVNRLVVETPGDSLLEFLRTEAKPQAGRPAALTGRGEEPK